MARLIYIHILIIYIIRIQPQKSQRLICSFVHKGSILTVLALDYSSTSIGLLQYSLLDYSSTCIGLLQYFYRITPVLLSESIKVLTLNYPNSYINSLLNHVSKTRSARNTPSLVWVMISFSRRAFLMRSTLDFVPIG